MTFFIIFYIIPFVFHTVFSIAEYKNKHRKIRIFLFDIIFCSIPLVNFITMIIVLIIFDIDDLLDSFIYEEDTH